MRQLVIPPINVPTTGSPVPLYSVHVSDNRGEYGDPRYRGNCSGEFVKDLLCFAEPGSVLDPMEGSGTVRDVCDELGISYVGFDLAQGVDATDPTSFTGLVGKFDVCWLQPPYWNLIEYSDDERDLSKANSLKEFLGRLSTVIANCKTALTEDGVLCVLMGDLVRHGKSHELPFLTWSICKQQGMSLVCPEIIRLSHGTTSARTEYSHSFIPRLHEVLLIMR